MGRILGHPQAGPNRLVQQIQRRQLLISSNYKKPARVMLTATISGLQGIKMILIRVGLPEPLAERSAKKEV